MTKSGKIIRRFLRVALFAAGLAFLAAAFLGHGDGYSTAAICFAAAVIIY
ncbi:MAG: hypothetical protein HDT13_04790 [Butyrivibrio sp.]|nr:hypothetical protein [Butyrivibrio sp.]